MENSPMQWVARGLVLFSLFDIKNKKEFMETYNAMETVVWIC